MEHFPEVKNVSWNHKEAGHGKGAPDGIGGVCERTADQVVARGRHISNFESLVNVLRECCPGSLDYEDVSSSAEFDEDFNEDLSLSDPVKTKSKIKFSDVYSDKEATTCSYASPKAKTGDYVLISLQSANKKLVDYRYAAVCQSDFQDGKIKVAFLKLSDYANGDTFRLGEENDISYVQEKQILEALPEPKLLIKGHRIYYQFPLSINVLETA